MRRVLGRVSANAALAVLLLGPATGPGLFAQTPSLQRTPERAPTALQQRVGTWLQVGYFNEVDQKGSLARTIHGPEAMRFRWGTFLSGADGGLWRLRTVEEARRGGEGGHTLLATGQAGPPGSVFTVDLRPYVPARPPAGGLRYEVQVVARRNASVDPGGATQPGQAGTKQAAREIGAWSPPVQITYVAGETPQIELPEVYRQVSLVLDEIVLVDDQYGSGREEYHVAGFVQELFRDCRDVDGSNCRFSTPGKQWSFGPDESVDLDCSNPRPYFRCLNPPSSSPFGAFQTYWQEPRRWSFRLDSTPGRWPRRYAVAVSLLEEDAGASVGAWNAGLEELQDAVKVGDLLEMDESELEQFLSEHAAEAIHYVADGVMTLASAVGAGSGAAAIGGASIAVVAYVVVSIVEDMEDDYYGTRMGTLTLASNRVDEIGQLEGRRDGDRFILDQQSLRFQGPPPANAAAAFDGIVDITYHWEFSDRVVE